MEQTLFAGLQPELRLEVLLRLPFEEASRQCQLFEACDNEKFWQQYVKQHYFITIKSQSLSWREVANMANDLLSMLFEKDVYPSFRVLPFLFENVFVDARAFHFVFGQWQREGLSQVLIGLPFLRDLSDETIRIVDQIIMSVHARLPVSNNPNDFTVRDEPLNAANFYRLTKFELHYRHEVMKIATTPTTYLIPGGQITVDLDIDHGDMIWPIDFPAVMSDFIRYTYEQVMIYQQLTFARYFVK